MSVEAETMSVAAMATPLKEPQLADGAAVDTAADQDPANAAAEAAKNEAMEAAKKEALRAMYKGTGIAKRSAGLPLSEYIQKKRLPVRKKEKAPKPTVEYVLDLGKKLGTCWRCTCPVHEADITDGYAEACDIYDVPLHDFECKQSEYADSCAEYAASHPEEVAAAVAAAAAAAAAVQAAPAAATEGEAASSPAGEDAPAQPEDAAAEAAPSDTAAAAAAAAETVDDVAAPSE